MTATAEVTRAFVVRPAEPYDLDDLVAALAQFAEFFGSRHSLFPGADAARRQLATLIATEPFFVVRDGCAFAGFIGGALAPHPYNPAIRVLSELFWWVEPAWRGSRAGLLLLEEFLRYGEQHADWIHCTLEAKSPVNERCLTKRGFALSERSYLREVVC